MLKQCEDSVSAKVEEMEQIKLRLEEAQQELLLTKTQVCNWAAAESFFFSVVIFYLVNKCFFTLLVFSFGVDSTLRTVLGFFFSHVT